MSILHPGGRPPVGIPSPRSGHAIAAYNIEIAAPPENRPKTPPARRVAALADAVNGSPTVAGGMPPRVLSLSSEFPSPVEPGKGLFVRARLRAVAARADLTVVAPVALVDYANPHNDFFAARKIPTRRRDGTIDVYHPRWLYPPRGGVANAFFLFARLLGHVARLGGRHRFDIIDAHYGHPEGIAAALLGNALGIPFIVTLRGSELRYRQPARVYWTGWALRKAGCVISVSEGLRQFALGLDVPPERTRVIPNGINADVFHPRDRIQARRAHDIPEDAKVILSAGDLAELKGHHRIIRALRSLRDQHLDAILLIAGGVGRSGRYAATLRDIVVECGLQDAVRFVGEMKQDSLAELMAAADVFCLASSSEGWPNVVNEALACGTPVVATNVGAVPQMLASREYGNIVAVNDHDSLTAGLADALTREWDRAAIAAWGGARSWDAVAGEVIDVINDVIREHRLANAPTK